ncbi:MAG: hypothetical protein GXP26_07095 [Planctomycetes bacterium]|nr:hypothetical protein [Planctomycetota bacterium]
MKFWKSKTTAAERREKQLRNQVAELESKLAAKDRAIAVNEAEIESLAAVIARDRQRVQAETATYVRQRAECEGTKNVSTDKGTI